MGEKRRELEKMDIYQIVINRWKKKGTEQEPHEPHEPHETDRRKEHMTT